jgi:cytochrome b
MARLAIRVWDPLVRVLHWALVASVAASWLTREGWGRPHEWIGYSALAIVAMRVAWGFTGPRYARFTAFVRSPTDVLRYAAAAVHGRAPRYIGHNPLGAWMIVALVLDVALVALSGWLYTTDAFWGVEWVARTHDALAKSLLVLIALHVLGVVATSLAHRENLAASMLHGRKRAADPQDVA